MLIIVFLGINFIECVVVFYVYFEFYYGYKFFSYIIFVFDMIYINDGNGYSNDDGIFIVLRIGVYVFYWLIIVDVYFWVSVEIVVNGILIGCVVIDFENVNDWGIGSELVVMWVNMGDCVFFCM